MLMEWLKPAIEKRVENIHAHKDPGIIKSSRAYHETLEKLEKLDHRLNLEMDESVNAYLAEQQLFFFRKGLTDGLALQQEIAAFRFQPNLQSTESTISVDTVTRSLAVIAKQSMDLGWELIDLFKRKKVDAPHLLHHLITDNLLDLIHNLNGVPKQGENGFSRDNWDDDFAEFFAGHISLDECMRLYAERLSTLK